MYAHPHPLPHKGVSNKYRIGCCNIQRQEEAGGSSLAERSKNRRHRNPADIAGTANDQPAA
jgi:hypothetical protein